MYVSIPHMSQYYEKVYMLCLISFMQRTVHLIYWGMAVFFFFCFFFVCVCVTLICTYILIQDILNSFLLLTGQVKPIFEFIIYIAESKQFNSGALPSDTFRMILLCLLTPNILKGRWLLGPFVLQTFARL